MRHKRNAFTLVELLIVVVVIVILSSMLMLSGGEAKAAARATKIVNGLTDLKMFALTWYKNNIDKFDKDGKFYDKTSKTYIDLETYFKTSAGQAEIKNFLTGNFEINYTKGSGGYGLISGKNNDGNPAWYACHFLLGNSERDKIKPKLKSKANLAKGNTNSDEKENVLMQGSSKNWESYTDGDEIYMPVLVFNY